ncbi:FtsX-like permease family protein [Microbacterium invictum]|uniref:FtsX-like permease family protein n=1 Tax=Microbacterium invictum TaxID=515415 RepID=A0ABZ0VAX1_9MICO|nr:FtsX-like permease family protein [Microbacterium invictum]WQB70763.1 FtsX-like permease family protein [Microbacterium invictum]
MTRRSRVGTLALLGRLSLDGLGATLLIALLVSAAVFAAAIAPRLGARLGTAELQQSISAMPAPIRDIRAVGTIGLVPGLAGTPVDRLVAPTDAAIAAFGEDLTEPLRSLTGDPAWVARSEPRDAVPVGDSPARADPEGQTRFFARLAVDPGWRDRVEIVAGTPPAAWAGDESARGVDPPLEVALSTATAEAAGITVGETLRYGALELVVTALYDPLDPDASHWAQVSDLAQPIVETAPGEPATVRGTVIVDTASLGGLTTSLTTGTFLAYYPVSAETLQATDAERVLNQLRSALAGGIVMPYGGEVTVTTLLGDEIEEATGRTATVTALLALALSGLLGVVLAVFALGIDAVATRRRPILDLTHARGASDLQLRAALGLEGVAIALPAAVVGVGVATALVPEPVGVSGWALPALVAAAVPALFALRAAPATRRQTRRDPHRIGGRRLLIDGGVVALAALSVILLARRGVDPSAGAGIDPLLVLAPLLVAAAVCLVALRFAPIPLLLLQHRLRRGDSAVALLGAARAVRVPSFGFAASFALILGVAVVVFSSILGSTIRSGIVTGAQEGLGSDILVSAPAIPSPAVEGVAGLPGVAAVSAITEIAGVRVDDAAAPTSLTLLVADTTALADVRPDLPALSGLADRAGSVPLLVSDDVAAALGPGARIGRSPVVVAGSAPVTALPGPGRSWAVVDASHLDALAREPRDPDRLLVALSDGADPSALGERVDAIVSASVPEAERGGVSTVAAADLISRARTSPLTQGLEAALPWAAAAALGLTLAGIALATVSAAQARARSVAVLRIIGADARQQRRLLLWEFAPPVLVAVLVGIAIGFLLPRLVTAVVDLRPFVGGRLAPPLVIDPASLAIALAAVAMTTAIAAVIAFAIAARHTPATTLRMGER